MVQINPIVIYLSFITSMCLVTSSAQSRSTRSQSTNVSQDPVLPIIATTTVIVEGQAEVEEAKGRVTGVVAKQGYTAMKTDAPLIRTPQSISVVTRDHMDLLASDSVAEALNYSSGVTPMSGGTVNTYNSVQLRGIGSGDPYLDGLGAKGGRKMNAWLLERVEVIKGSPRFFTVKGPLGGGIQYGE